MERIEIVENGLFLVFEIADDKCFKFLMIVPMSAMETNIL